MAAAGRALPSCAERTEGGPAALALPIGGFAADQCVATGVTISHDVAAPAAAALVRRWCARSQGNELGLERVTASDTPFPVQPPAPRLTRRQVID